VLSAAYLDGENTARFYGAANNPAKIDAENYAPETETA
jgi:hypothetical protein